MRTQRLEELLPSLFPSSTLLHKYRDRTQTVYDQMSYRQLVEVFEELASGDDPFVDYPIVRIWPRR